jgi:flap endonuclease-1
MGIKGLQNLITDSSPNSVKEDILKNYFSRTVAIDASMTIYQFLISIKGAYGADLQNDSGEVTNHLQGLLYRTTRMLEYGLRPVYVFDGKPPEMKGDELQKRKEKREKAQKELEVAKDEGDEEAITMLSKRTIRVGKKENDECKKLLTLMGCPIVEAPTEAEAQCAEMCKGGLVFGTATEDMDALTYGTPTLVRHLTFSEARKLPIREINLAKVLEGMKLNMDQFIDLCILCGCDYCCTIRGIGPKKGLSLMQKYGSIENVIKHLKEDKKSKYEIPTEFEEQFAEARRLFKNPEVIPAKDIVLKWNEPDVEGLINFLVKEKQFDEKKVETAIDRIKTSRKQTTQTRLSNFFTVIESSPKKKDDKDKKSAKRKKDEKNEKSKKKK